ELRLELRRGPQVEGVERLLVHPGPVDQHGPCVEIGRLRPAGSPGGRSSLHHLIPQSTHANSLLSSSTWAYCSHTPKGPAFESPGPTNSRPTDSSSAVGLRPSTTR